MTAAISFAPQIKSRFLESWSGMAIPSPLGGLIGYRRYQPAEPRPPQLCGRARLLIPDGVPRVCLCRPAPCTAHGKLARLPCNERPHLRRARLNHCDCSPMASSDKQATVYSANGSGSYVARMSHGLAAPSCKSLVLLGSRLQHTQHEKGSLARAIFIFSSIKTSWWER